jgi:hypothetical protein
LWAVKLYQEWVDYVLQHGDDDVVKQTLLNTSDLLTLSEHDINLVLSSFVLSLKKRDGGDYTSGSLFSIIMAIQKHLEVNGRRVFFLNDPRFTQLKNCLDNVMQAVTQKGVGLVKRQASVITQEQENTLWEKGILGTSNPKTLFHTLFWTVGVNFGLRGGDEHRNLTQDNFRVVTDTDGLEYLEYCESISKTYKGGLKHRRIEPHRARAYAIPGSDRCPVKLYRTYISRLNPSAQSSTFYFQPLTTPAGSVWFSLAPVGHNKLKDIVKTMMQMAGYHGYYTNHSLRATTATRLFKEHIPEQMIMEQTGHRSNAINNYKRTTDEQKRLVSAVLQGTTKPPFSHFKDEQVNQTATGLPPSLTDKKSHNFNVTNSTIHFHL